MQFLKVGLLVVVMGLIINPVGVFAANTTTLGELIVEPATLNSLGFEWHISGDDNRNGRVEVQYRKTGETSWKRGMDFNRTKNEEIGKGNDDYHWFTGNTFAGSVMFLQPGSSYDVKLRMIDPDGSLDTTREITTSTYRLPIPNANGTVLHVYKQTPANALSPNYTSIAQAINSANPGDTVLIHAGTYSFNQSEGIVIDNQGTADRTIYVRAEKLGDVTLEGNGRNTIVNIQNASNITFENLIFKNAFRAIYADAGLPIQPTGITVHNNIFYMSDDGDKTQSIVKTGVYCLHPKCEHFTILNNSFYGPTTPWHPRPSWYGVTFGVQLVGRGHSLGFNYLEDFWDGLNIDGFQPPDDLKLRTTSVDFYNNRITEMVDDAIQLDGGVHNLRVYDNYFYNLFMGITTQPVYGGPAYIFRNVIYNYTRQAIKLQVQPSGVWVINNTFVGKNGWEAAYGWHYSRLVNNLMFVTDQLKAGYIHTGTATPGKIEMDYNGYYNYTLPTDGRRIFWMTPDSTKDLERREEWFNTLTDFYNKYGYEQHHQIVDYSIFNSVPKPAVGIAPLPSGLDFRLKSGSPAIDTGKVIVGLNDNYNGSKPDLGAYELGQVVPHYGPKASSQLPGFSTVNSHPGVGQEPPMPSPSPAQTTVPSPTPINTPTASPLSPPEACKADINDDKYVDVSDYPLIVNKFFSHEGGKSDINGDGEVDTSDYWIFLQYFLKPVNC